MKSTTHFGYQDVPWEQKKSLVGEVFSSVASRYDVMNDVMSMGVHRLWKRHFVAVMAVRPGHQVLDLAGGTADIAALMSKRVGAKGQIVVCDINGDMLSVGRERMENKGFMQNLDYVQANAEQLSYPDNHFDRVTIAFGLRNVTDQMAALKEMYRVLKPGGKLGILEFSRPVMPGLKPVYDLYSFQLLPRMGKWIANDEESYRYLAESIRRHPDQETLKQMMVEAGFENADYLNMSGGIVALHHGLKL